jgi:poly(3-hydroxybutyrate) depolymerase
MLIHIMRMLHWRISAAAVVSIAALSGAAMAATITKESLSIDRDKRPYYLFVPDGLDATPVPLLIVLHGSGRDGRSLVEPWSDLAAREHFIVVGPDAADRRHWQGPIDGPAFLYFLVEAVKARHPIDTRRVYLFGHSDGAFFALTMSLMESEFFAATAVHAGGLYPNAADRQQLFAAPRTIPIAMFHGVDDQTISVGTAREARDALTAHGFPVTLTEIAGHDHDYYRRAEEINRKAWAFLKDQALEKDPQYQFYAPVRKGGKLSQQGVLR